MIMKKYSESQTGFLIVINFILVGLIIYASTSLTISFFGSIGEGKIQTSNLILGIVNDSCKIFFPICIGIALFKQKYFHATILITITICTMFISYMASQGLDLNIANYQILKTSNKQELISLKNENISYKKSIEDEKVSIIASLQAEKDSMPKNYITKKNLKQKQINKIIKDYDLKIAPYQSKINTYNAKIENYKLDPEFTTEGYHALSKSTGFSVDQIVKFKNILLEILAIVLSLNLGLLLGKTKLFNSETLMNTSSSDESEFNQDKKYKSPDEDSKQEYQKQELIKKDNVVPIRNIDNTTINNDSTIKSEKEEVLPTKTKIGFNYGTVEIAETLNNTNVQCDSYSDFSDEEVKRYLKYMYDTHSNNVSKGYHTISKHTGLSTETARKIKAHLEHRGIIKTHGNRTLIIAEKQRA